MKKKRLWISTLLVCFSLSVMGCSKVEKDIPELMEPVGIVIDTVEVQRGNLEDVTLLNGTVVPHVEALCFTEDGILEEMCVKVGDVVSKGQVLAVISQETLEEEIHQLEQEIQDIVKRGEFADRQTEAEIRAEKLELELIWENGELHQWKSGNGLIDYNIRYFENESRALKFQQTKELRELELSEKRKRLSQLKAKVGNQKILAPFTGQVVYAGEYEQGSKVKGFETVICLADETRLKVVSEFIAENDVKNAEQIFCRIGNREYALEYLPYTTEEYLELVFAGGKVDTRFQVAAGEGEITSGQYAAVFHVADRRENVLYLPNHALYQDGEGTYVYKMAGGQRVKTRIKTGIQTTNHTEIVAGLTEGEEIYVEEVLKTADQNADTVKKNGYTEEKTGSAEVVYLEYKNLAWDNGQDSIREILVRKGQKVKAGEVLAVFDVSEKKSELEALKLQLKRKQEDLLKESEKRKMAIEKAKEYAIYHYKYRELDIENFKIAKQQAQYEQYVYEAEKEIAKLQEQLSKLQDKQKKNQITAPFDGVIDWVAGYNPGDPAVAGSPLIRMYSIEYPVFEAAEVSDGLRYNMEVDVEISFGNKKESYKGRVISTQAILPKDVTQKKLLIQLEESIGDREITGRITYRSTAEEGQNLVIE